MPTPVQDAVAKLILEGWAVVPIIAGRKNPGDDDWLTKTYTAEDFTQNANIGVKNGQRSGWRVDIDMDAPEAVAAGQHLLRNTGLIHGRPGKPSSHWWYLAPGAVTQAFKDLNGDILVEIRSDGSQTVVPPSKHEKGDTLRWEQSGAPTTLTVEELLKMVRAVAIAALFARHWPVGGRHIAAGHLAGFLMRLGFEADWTVQIVRTAATIAKDEEVNDRARIAKDTAAKHTKGAKTTGGPKLAEHFDRGGDLAARVYEWMGLQGADLLDQLNARHFVAQLGADTVVGTDDEADNEKGVIFQTFEQFRQQYYNRFVGKKKLGEWWLSHPQRRSYRKVVFAPPPMTCHEHDYNTWRGFTVLPDDQPNPEQRCQLFLRHLFDVICDSDKTNFQFLLNVYAHTYQRPGTPSGIAVVFRGEQGAGKGTAVELPGQLFGRYHYTQISHQKHLVGNFNSVLSGKIMIFADEAFWAGNKQDVGSLRRLITERTLTIERKYMDAVSEPNCIHLFMATNENWVWPAAFKERRGFILDVALKSFQTQQYFRDLYHEWETGGAQAFLAFCLQRQLPDRLGAIPVTSALIEQQQLSYDGFVGWWHDKLMKGELGPPGSGWPSFIASNWLYADYIEHTRLAESSHNRRGTETTLGKRLKTLLPESATRERQYSKVNMAPPHMPPVWENAQCYGWALPSLFLCRQAFDAASGVKNPWPPEHAGQQAFAVMGGDREPF